MANIIQNSIGKIQNYIRSKKEVSPVPAPKPIQYKDFSYNANNLKRAILRPIVNTPSNIKSAYTNPNFLPGQKKSLQDAFKMMSQKGPEQLTTEFGQTLRGERGFFGQTIPQNKQIIPKIPVLKQITQVSSKLGETWGGAPARLGVGLMQLPEKETRKEGLKNVAMGGIGTALTIGGAKTITPKFAIGSGIIGSAFGGGAKIWSNMQEGKPLTEGLFGTMASQGIESAARSVPMSKILQYTAPAIENIGKFAQGSDLFKNMPDALKAQILDRTLGSILNVGEGLIIDRGLGLETDAASIGLDVLTGAAMGTGAVKSLNTRQSARQAQKELARTAKESFDSAMKSVLKSGMDEYKSLHPGASDDIALKAVKEFWRNEKGQFASGPKKSTFIKDSKITDADRKALRKKYGLPDDGRYDKGFIDFGFDKKPEVSVDKKGKIKFKPQDVKIEEPDINIRSDVQKILDQGKYSRTGIKESLQDSYIRIKRLQNLKNVKVDEKSNIYVAEELMHGRVGTRLMNSFDEVKAIDDKIVQLEKIDKNINKKVQEYLIAQHAPERNKALGENAAGMTTKEANKILKDLENDPNAAQIKEVVQDFENLNKKVLDTLYEGQIITKELYDGLRSKYKHHVPLNRIMDETDDITQILTGRGRDVRGTGIKSAKGSEREVSDIAGNIVTNLQQAIIRSEKNKVNLAVLEFARQNPELGLFEIEKPKAIGTSFDGRPIMAKTNDPQILTLRENGKEVQLRIKNDNLAATIRGINIQKLPEFFNGVSAFTRFYSQLHTRFNPEFAIPNIVRDSQEMATYLSSQKDIGITGAGKALSKQPQSVKVMIDAVRGVDNADTRLYKQMQMDGGTTGGMALSTKQDVEMNIEKIRQLNRSNPRKAASKVLESFDTWNQVFEDATRFSVYKQALENGASRQRAASLAKNASLNFNRKGTATPIVNSLWMFSNASIQGTTKMLTALKNPKTLAAVTAAVGSSVYATNEWNDAVDPDWREKVTEWDQQSNLVVMLPSKNGAKYITIPVSWGLKPIKTTMDAMYRVHRGDDMNFQKASEDIAQAFIDGYNPTGGTDLISSVMPTILDIPVELIRNKGWYGGPIKPTYLEGEPEQKQYKKSTEKKLSGRVAIYIADKLAQYSADKIAISPDHILYAYNQYIGGVGRFGTKIFDTASSLTKGNAPDLNTVPFSSRFLKEKTEDDIKTQKYYDGMDKISQKYTKSWDTKLENAYSYLKSPKTIDEYGFQSRNINESLAFAQIRLANPQIVAREAEEARLRSKINGTPYNPMYDLPYDKQRVVLTLASLPPGQQKSALQKENIEWLKPYWNDVAKYSNEMKRLGIFKDNPNYETAPKASARAQALMDQGNWNDPEVRAYLQANNEYKNRVLAELGLPPLESTTSKWGSYTKRPKKVSFNMGKVKKARVVKSSPQKIFGTRKISTPKIKAVEAPRVRAVARIDTPRIRKVKFKA